MHTSRDGLYHGCIKISEISNFGFLAFFFFFFFYMGVNGEYLGNRYSLSETDQNLGLRGKYLVYTGYFCLSSVQLKFGVIRCISDF